MITLTAIALVCLWVWSLHLSRHSRALDEREAALKRYAKEIRLLEKSVSDRSAAVDEYVDALNDRHTIESIQRRYSESN